MKISEFQELIKEIYFHQDKERGIKGTFIWLVEEVGELARIIKNQRIDIRKASEEIADIYAWINSIANLLEIDMESILKDKYPDKCIRCGLKPCQCDLLRDNRKI
ncbi:MAG: MazG nucleotide pyrophosphohydrolase domain-containing protein [Promethearchaeota archaeon]